MNFEGHGDYNVIGNSMSNDEDREDCRINFSSSSSFSIPTGARIKKVLLYWSASGTLTKSAEVNLNGRTVRAARTYHGGYNAYRFYGAEADVTHLVSPGFVTVSGIWYDNRGQLCTGNAAYAAWNMVIVYVSPFVPRARINLCSDWFRFTFPAGSYSSHVGCINYPQSSFSKTTVVTYESDNYKGEHFFINGGYRGDNLFRGTRAPNLDIRTFDITSVVRSGAHSIVYTIRSYLVHSRFGPAVEGLFMPIRVVLYRL